MSLDLKINVPYSACGTNERGEILNWKNEVIPIVEIDGKMVVKLDWIYGNTYYDAALVILVAYGRVELPLNLYSEVEPLFKDGNYKNVFPSNLMYRFRNGPLECSEYPGYYYIPFFTKYVINREGTVISLINGCEKSFYTAPPLRHKKITAGYRYTRLMTPNGESKMAAQHRILCYTFKRYEADVMKMVVNHIDGNPTNNHLDNMELVTNAENIKHAFDTGLVRRQGVPFLVKNLKTGEIKRYTNQKHYATEIGHQTG